MPINFGIAEIQDIKFGNNQIAKVYQGNDLVWQKSTTIELRKINNFREVSQQFANNKIKMPDDSEMRKTTWKMKNHGFLKPRRETERSRSTPV